MPWTRVKEDPVLSQPWAKTWEDPDRWLHGSLQCQELGYAAEGPLRPGLRHRRIPALAHPSVSWTVPLQNLRPSTPWTLALEDSVPGSP